jgi:multidrug resistance efflux pump
MTCRLSIALREAEDATAEALREVAQLEGQLQQARTLGEELSETTAALTRRLEEEQVSAHRRQKGLQGYGACRCAISNFRFLSSLHNVNFGAI